MLVTMLVCTTEIVVIMTNHIGLAACSVYICAYVYCLAIHTLLPFGLVYQLTDFAINHTNHTSVVLVSDVAHSYEASH